MYIVDSKEITDLKESNRLLLDNNSKKASSKTGWTISNFPQFSAQYVGTCVA